MAALNSNSFVVHPKPHCHIVALPYPGRGHINPLMNLCKLLVLSSPPTTNILVTLVVTEEWLSFIRSEKKPDNIRFATIPNVIPSEYGRGENVEAFIEAVVTKMEEPFEQLLDQLVSPPTTIIYDSFVFWAVRVGNQRNIPVACFYSMSASVFSVFQHFHLFRQNKHFPIHLKEKGEERVDYIPGLSSTRLADFPGLLEGNHESMLKRVMESFQWLQKATYLLFASIYELEPAAFDVLKEEFSIPIYPIGPLIPYFSLEDKPHVRKGTNDEGYSYFQWLDSQPPSSVLYISQGSFLSNSSDQIDELAVGLRDSGVPFLWVARGEASRLKDVCGDKGLVVSWCDQLRVLMHPAIGGFWSHCGWNSTREGVFAGLPFLTFPILMDQNLNSKRIVEDWKIGWRVKEDIYSNSLVTSDEIARLIVKFMELQNDVVSGMRTRARELQQVCRRAVADGGPIETNIATFLRNITCADIN